MIEYKELEEQIPELLGYLPSPLHTHAETGNHGGPKQSGRGMRREGARD
jgi:hypothetical protein